MTDYLLGLYEKSMPNTLSIYEKLKEAKMAGFDYLELSIDETDGKLARLEWGAEEISAINTAQSELNLPIKSLCLSGHRKYPLGSSDEKTRSKGLDIMKKTIKLASKLGIRIIMIAGYDVYYEESTQQTVENFSKNLKIAVEMAAREGIILGFETMETPFMDNVQKAMKWVNEIKSPYLQIYPDAGNVTNSSLIYQVDPVKDFLTGEGHLVAVHLKDTTPGIYREIPFGKGHVDFKTITSTAYQLGVRMFVGEFWYTGEENWQEILKNNNMFLRKFLDTASH